MTYILRCLVKLVIFCLLYKSSSLFSQSLIIKDSSSLKHILSDSLNSKGNVLPDSLKFPKRPTIKKYEFKKPQIKKILGISGQISIETYYSSFQNPRMMNQPYYARISGQPSVSLVGLPFIVDFYYTTEKNTYYNANSISFRFDYDAYLRNQKQKLQTDLNANTSNRDLHSYDMQKQNQLLEQNANQQELLVKQREALNNRYQEEFAEYQRRYLEDSLNALKAGVKDSLDNNTDSLNRLSYRLQRSHDSANLKQIEADTMKLYKKYQEAQLTYTKIQSKKKFLDSSITADSAKISGIRRQINDPSSLTSVIPKDSNSSKIMAVANRIKNFELGNASPYTHDFSAAGIALRGINTTFSLQKFNITLAGGRAIRNDANAYNRSNSKYSRNFGALAIEHQIGKSGLLSVFGHYANDPEKLANEGKYTAVKNGVFGFNVNVNPLQIATIDFSLAKSKTSDYNPTVVQTIYPNTNLSSKNAFLFNAALRLKMEKEITKSIKLEGLYTLIGPGFKNLGNPYMRTNYKEYQAKLLWSPFKNQLQLATFFKQFQDNPLGASEVTNKTKGYGFSAKTAFANKKLPNFSFSISPYEQGNNHPDSLLKINNRFALINGGMTYRKSYRKLRYFFLGYVSQSQMQLNANQKTKVRSITLNQDLGIGKKITLGISSTFLRTNPGIDSSQANIWQTRLTWNFTKKITITGLGQSATYLNGAYKRGGSIIVSSNLDKHFRLSLKFGYDHIHRLWNVTNRDAFMGLLRVDVRW